MKAISPAAVGKILVGITDVIRIYNQIDMQVLPQDDVIAVLNMLEEEEKLSEGSWVRIRKRGTYHRDLGIIKAVRGDILDVLVVPRLSLDRKQKNRAQQALFSESLSSSLFPDEPIVHEAEAIKFRRKRYFCGLLLRKFKVSQVTAAVVKLEAMELERFRQSRHALVLATLNAQRDSLALNDRVQVVLGEHIDVRGRITSFTDDDTLSIFSEAADPPSLISVSKWEVRRKFLLGDHVEVMFGEHRGLTGFVVSLDEEGSALLYASGEAGEKQEVSIR